jgi:hypothetical protein
MGDDKAEDGEKHTVPTVPPPAGETDIYDAKTQVGGLPPEALALLRQMRDEEPSRGPVGEANVPVFTDDSDADAVAPSGRLPLVRPAAGAPAAAVRSSPTPVEPATKPGDAPPVITPVAPQAAPMERKAENAWLAGLASRGTPEADPSEPEHYASVFAPLPESSASPEVSAADRTVSRKVPPPGMLAVWVVAGLAAVVVAALVFVLLGQAGWIPGFRAPPPASQH